MLVVVVNTTMELDQMELEANILVSPFDGRVEKASFPYENQLHPRLLEHLPCQFVTLNPSIWDVLLPSVYCLDSALDNQ